jgi:hypothetical protein
MGHPSVFFERMPLLLHMFTHLSHGPFVGEQNGAKDAKIEGTWLWSARGYCIKSGKAGCNAVGGFGV